MDIILVYFIITHSLVPCQVVHSWMAKCQISLGLALAVVLPLIRPGGLHEAGAVFEVVGVCPARFSFAVP